MANNQKKLEKRGLKAELDSLANKAGNELITVKEISIQKNSARVKIDDSGDGTQNFKLPNLTTNNNNNKKPTNENTNFVATNSQIESSNYYSLDFKYTGLAVMINNFKFSNQDNNFPDQVVDKDVESFETLKKFNFQTNVFLNQSKFQIDHLITYYTLYDYSDYACVFICMSSHGGQHTILSSDCVSIEIAEDIIEPFYKVESLKNKPKIFLFDCCRGEEVQALSKADGTNNKKKTKIIKEFKFADLSNFFFAYSTVINFISELSIRRGSYFMSAFFEVLDNHGKTDDWDELKRKVVKVMKERFRQIPVFESRSEFKLAFVKMEKKEDLPHQDLQIQLQQQQQQQQEFQQQLQNQLQQQLQQMQLQLQQSLLEKQQQREQQENQALLQQQQLQSIKIEPALGQQIPAKIEPNVVDTNQSSSLIKNTKTLTNESKIRCLLTLRDGTLAVGSLEFVTIWNVETGTKLRNLKTGNSFICSMKELADGTLAGGYSDCTIKLWNPQIGKHLKTLREDHFQFTYDVLALEQLRNEKLVSGSDEGMLRIWNVQKGKLLDSIYLVGKVCQIIILKDENLAVRCGSNRVDQVVIVNPATLQELKCIKHPEWDVNAIALLSDGNLAIGRCKITIWNTNWNATSGKLLKTLEGHSVNITCLKLLGDGCLASGDQDGDIRIWEPKSGKLLHSFRAHNSSIYSLTTLNDGSLVSASWSELTIKVWNM